MSREVNTHPEQITRSGQRVNYPEQSSIYSINPCPPLALFSKLKANYYDAEYNAYWDLGEHDKLALWAAESGLTYRLDKSTFDVTTDNVFFVKQNATQKKNCSVFELPETGTLKLWAVAKNAQCQCYTCDIIEVGQNASSSYKARSVRWMLVRSLTVTSDD